MRKLIAPLLVVAIALAFFSGCSSTPLTGYAVELVKIERKADGPAIATLQLVNPNVIAYNIDSSVHAVFFDGKPVGMITVTAPEGVPPGSKVIQTGTFTPATGYKLTAGSVSYRLDSTLTIRLYGDELEKKKLSTSGTTEIVLQ